NFLYQIVTEILTPQFLRRLIIPTVGIQVAFTSQAFAAPTHDQPVQHFQRNNHERMRQRQRNARQDNRMDSTLQGGDERAALSGQDYRISRSGVSLRS